MKSVRAAVVAAVAVCLVLGIAVPTASAAKGPTAKSLDRKANRAIRNAAAAKTSADKAASDLAAAVKRLGTTEGGLAGVLAATPKIVDYLTKLGGVLQKDIAPGLNALAVALRDQIVPSLTALSNALTKQIVPGLTRLSEYVGAQEYGAVVGRIELPPAAGGSVSVTATLTSADIPDSGSAAPITAANVPIDLTGVARGAGNVLIGLRGAIRSAEADGAAAGDPAGQLGGTLTLTCLGGGCADGGGAPKSGGELVCTATTPPAFFPTPAGGIALPLATVQEKVPLTDIAQPGAGSTDILGSACAVKGGAMYGLSVTASAADIPTKASPGPKD